MNLNFKITNLLKDTPVMEFFLFPSVHFQYIDLMGMHSHSIKFEVFAWRMTLIMQFPEKRDNPVKE